MGPALHGNAAVDKTRAKSTLRALRCRASHLRRRRAWATHNAASRRSAPGALPPGSTRPQPDFDGAGGLGGAPQIAGGQMTWLAWYSQLPRHAFCAQERMDVTSVYLIMPLKVSPSSPETPIAQSSE